ncbi:hypothetical protein Tco_1061991, partial [Tanacetum coccineum]
MLRAPSIQQSKGRAGSPASHETNADGRVDKSGDSDDTLETLFVAVEVLATLNLNFANTELAPKFLDFAAIREVN